MSSKIKIDTSDLSAECWIIPQDFRGEQSVSVFIAKQFR